MLGLSLGLLLGCEPEVVDTRDCDTRSVFYVDADGDGFGDPLQVVLACEARDGLAANPDDCDDTDGAVTTGCDTDTDTGGSTSGTQDTDTGDTDTDTGDTATSDPSTGGDSGDSGDGTTSTTAGAN